MSWPSSVSWLASSVDTAVTRASSDGQLAGQGVDARIGCGLGSAGPFHGRPQLRQLGLDALDLGGIGGAPEQSHVAVTVHGARWASR